MPSLAGLHNSSKVMPVKVAANYDGNTLLQVVNAPTVRLLKVGRGDRRQMELGSGQHRSLGLNKVLQLTADVGLSGGGHPTEGLRPGVGRLRSGGRSPGVRRSAVRGQLTC